MSKSGNPLRDARESKNLTLAQVESALRIKARYLQALEEDRWDDLPGPVQARGFIKNYAAFLGLDGDVVARLEKREAASSAPSASQFHPAAPPSAPPAQASPPAFQMPAAPPASTLITPDPLPTATRPPAEPLAAPPAPPPAPAEAGLPGWLSVDMLAGGVALVLFVIVALLAARAYLLPLINTLTAPIPTPTGAAVTLPQSAQTPTSNATPTPVFPVNPNGGIQLGLVAMEHAWARITTDGTTAFEGLLTPGQALTWEAREQLIVETGNGAAFNLVLNGKTMGPLGARDKIVIRAWSPRGEVIPPPTPSPLPPTETPEPVPTLAPPPSPAP